MSVVMRRCCAGGITGRRAIGPFDARGRSLIANAASCIGASQTLPVDKDAWTGLMVTLVVAQLVRPIPHGESAAAPVAVRAVRRGDQIRTSVIMRTRPDMSRQAHWKTALCRSVPAAKPCVVAMTNRR